MLKRFDGAAALLQKVQNSWPTTSFSPRHSRHLQLPAASPPATQIEVLCRSDCVMEYSIDAAGCGREYNLISPHR